MAYTITKTNGVTLGTIADGTVDDPASGGVTSLVLVGRNYSNYGQIMTDNLVALLENFANSISPSEPLPGQLWWNTSDDRLRVYTGTEFKVVSSCTAQTTAPSTTVAGDLWWETDEEQLFVYNGTSPYTSAGWILVGPPYKKTKGKGGAIWEQITDTVALVHDVISIYKNGTRLAIITTEDNWQPAVSITGFTTLRTGHNLSSAQTLWGTANNASYLGGALPGSYLRSDQNDTTSGTFGVLNDTGVTVGEHSDLQLKVNGNNIEVRNATLDGDISVFVNDGTVDTAAITVDGATTNVTTNNNLTVGNDLSVTSDATITGDLAVTGVSAFTGNVTAPTQGAGTADTTVATTEFVINNSGFLKNKIYDGGNAAVANTFLSVTDTGTGSATLQIDGTQVMSATAVGVHLESGATTDTQPDTYNGTGNAAVATTQFVKTATTWWGNASHRSAKVVSTDAPNAGVNDGGTNDGDFWFQRES